MSYDGSLAVEISVITIRTFALGGMTTGMAWLLWHPAAHRRVRRILISVRSLSSAEYP